ncbi:hypothetical protein [Metabacillus halosaccharovorans]|uniref:hypothetical protein n=1 Tax=Metabacillus halosaccharovorans TaxID=930124 RepID=UPI001C1FF74B|nr:hypothetical protein [Metabacillus halosaccharovorans]MBU7594270.1 hypothetical protein [Metabacillus halosaccharovorans]
MKKQRILIIFTVASLLLMIGSILYQTLQDRDPYRFYTGLGQEFDIAPDDSHLAFSYFLDGHEAIYMSNLDGSDVTRLSEKIEGRSHSPKFSHDGEELLFLSEDDQGIQTITVMNRDGSDANGLTLDGLHVTDAVFASDNETIFFTAMLASEVGKLEGETKEGYDLYQVDRQSGQIGQLTDKDHFSMNNLSISTDGETLYYSLFESNEQPVAYSLEKKTETPVVQVNGDMYSSVFSEDGSLLAYTAVTDQSKNSSLFHYELFVKIVESNKVKQLTDLQANVQSPVFLHKTDYIAFLQYENWPEEPEYFQLMTVSLEGDVKPELIELDLPGSSETYIIPKTIEFLLSEQAIAVYYVLFFVGLILVAKRRSGKVYLPSLVSLALSVLTFVGSFIVGFLANPWYGIGLSIVAITMFVCSLFLIVVSFSIKRFTGKS